MKFICLFILLASSMASAENWYENLKMPKEFSVTKYADVKDARQMALSPSGMLYVGSMEEGKVYAVDASGKVTIIKDQLNRPQGVLWHNNDLYIAEISKVSKIKDVDQNYSKSPTLIAIKSDFPSDTHHGWKTLGLGPDGKIYVPVGAPCNICKSPLPYQAIHRMDPDGKNFETVASGIRNTVGFAWHPETKLLYFTEMGRDLMGDNIPPDEINVISFVGENFGYPYIHAGTIVDTGILGSMVPKNFKHTPPLWKIQAHSAPIGIVFFPKEFYPKEFQNCFMVAEHGSWNRMKKSGYQISKGCLENGKVKSYEPMITGFKEGEKTLGRPVHFQFLKDGSFLVSDDDDGKILKFSYKSL